MNTLQERLAKLAEHAPAGGAPPAELWARGKRAYRLRVAAVAATVMVAVAAAVASIGLGLSDGERHRSDLVPASTVGVSLPIGYPVSERLPDLGAAPGPLLAIWVTPRSDGAPEVVGLVAESGVFGTLPIDPWVDVEYSDAKPGVALSPDGRRIAYEDRMGARGEVLVVRDLVTGEEESPRIEEHGLIPYDWMDATHLYGLARGPFATGDAEGWVWEPGTAAKLVDFVDYPYPGHAYLGTGGPYGGTDLAIGDLRGNRSRAPTRYASRRRLTTRTDCSSKCRCCATSWGWSAPRSCWVTGTPDTWWERWATRSCPTARWWRWTFAGPTVRTTTRPCRGIRTLSMRSTTLPDDRWS